MLDSATPIVVLDAANGSERHFELSGMWAPACDGDSGFLAVGAELSSVDLRNASVHWKLSLGSSGTFDDIPAMPPIVVNGFVYVIDYKGRLSAVEATTGRLVWKDSMAVHDPAWVESGGTPRRAIAAGEERLVVPFERTLYAYF